MSGEALQQSAPSAADAVAAEERLLRALFAALPDAMAEPDFGVALAQYLRRRMQRLQPPGKRGLRAVRSHAGLTFSIDVGNRFAAEIYYGQFAEVLELALMAALAEPGSIVVDAGANLGLYADRPETRSLGLTSGLTKRVRPRPPGSLQPP